MLDECEGSEDGADGALFVLDTEGAEIVEVEKVKSSCSAVRTPEHGLKKGKQGTSKIKAKDGAFDLTKILTNDAILPSPSEEKKERLFRKMHSTQVLFADNY